MDANTFTAIFDDQVAVCRDLLVTKAKEYASDADRLHNFRVAADLQGISREQALGGMLTKHIVSIFDMLPNAEEYSKAKWDEKITDAMNYLFLLQALIQDK